MSSQPAFAALLADGAAAEGGAGTSGLFMLALFALPLLFLFFMMRSQRTKQKRAAEEQQSLGLGDEVMTGGGLYGTIVGGDDKIVLVEAAPGIQLRFDRRAIMPAAKEQPSEPPVEGDDTQNNEN